jgi:dTDP-4-dehydrorhamnose reductase
MLATLRIYRPPRPDAADTVLDLLQDETVGEITLLGSEAWNWADLAALMAKEAGLDPASVEAVMVASSRPRCDQAPPLPGLAKAMLALEVLQI